MTEIANLIHGSLVGLTALPATHLALACGALALGAVGVALLRRLNDLEAAPRPAPRRSEGPPPRRSEGAPQRRAA